MFQLSNTMQGILLLVGGTVLLLHTLGIFQQTLGLVIILGAIAMIVFGFLKVDGPRYIQNLLKKQGE